MLTVLIKDDGEPNVTMLTYENLWKELSEIPGSKLEITSDWFSALDKADTPYVCIVEADCLISSNYYKTLLGLFKKHVHNKGIIFSSATAVNRPSNRFFGYNVGNNYSDGLIPNRENTSRVAYPVEIAYVPGAIMRTDAVRDILKKLNAKPGFEKNLVKMSADMSLEAWRMGRMVYVYPHTTYTTTEEYVSNIVHIDHGAKDLINQFRRRGI